jgi:photosystem II stability/assembly factor-like uncharacterized protein
MQRYSTRWATRGMVCRGSCVSSIVTILAAAAAFTLAPPFARASQPSDQGSSDRAAPVPPASSGEDTCWSDLYPGQHTLPQEKKAIGPGPHKKKFGPPPPGYIRVDSEPVPDWTPTHFSPRGKALNWYLLGPKPIEDEYWSGSKNASGRVNSIAPHPTDPNTVYIASASGGVWKTTDGGTNWKPLTDELSTLVHGVVAVDPNKPDTVYMGTGDFFIGARGDGIYRSDDGGMSWVKIGAVDQVGSRITGIVVDPTDSDIIHVSGSFGYVRSKDRGKTWERTQPNDLGNLCCALVVNPADPKTIYVGKYYSGVWRSTDGGNTFVKLTTGLPNDDVNRICLAISKSDPKFLLCGISNGGSGVRGTYRSVDGGDTWLEIAGTPDFAYPQSWYDMYVAIDPANKDIMYLGGVDPRYAPAGVLRTTDGGGWWVDITFAGDGTNPHPDHQCIAFGADGTVWEGNDGGVWKRPPGKDTWVNCNATLTLTENYQIAVHPVDDNQVMGGTQDNGTVGRFKDSLVWPQIVAGDGGYLAYDFVNPDNVYTTYVYLTVFRINLAAWTGDEITGPWGGDWANFIAPLIMDPNESETLLGGTYRVWRNTNALSGTSADWTPISGDLGGGGVLNAIAVAKGASDTIYTGASSGRVYVTTNAADWVDRTAGLPGGEVSDISVSPFDPGTAYIGFYNTSGPRVLKTVDFGANWTDVTGSLPSGAAARAIEVDWLPNPPHVYVGAGHGVYGTFNGGATWEKDGSDLPNVNIGDLVIHPGKRTITAGTYGRGAWRSALPVCRADFNGDKRIDVKDYDDFVKAFEAGAQNSDFDGSGFVDTDDFDDFVRAYERGC